MSAEDTAAAAAAGNSDGGRPRERRKRGFESVDPAALAIVAGLPTITVLNDDQRKRLALAKEYAAEETARYTRTILDMQQQQELAARMQIIANRQRTVQVLCRVYVGSIPFENNAVDVEMVFNQFGPVREVAMSMDHATGQHKGFCFIEYYLPESAVMVLEQMNGYNFKGRAVKVGRPNNAPPALPMMEEMMRECEAKGRIFISSIHPELSRDDIKGVFEAFGPIKECILIPDMLNAAKHRGCGFIDYETPSAAVDAIASMNKYNLGGLVLRVGKAVSAPEIVNSQLAMQPIAFTPAAAAAQAAAQALAARLPSVTPAGTVVPTVVPPVAPTFATTTLPSSTATIAAQQQESLHKEEGVMISGVSQRQALMQKLARGSVSSKVIVLKNMVDSSDVDESLEQEVKEECEIYGRVLHVVVHVNRSDDQVFLFVKFASVEEAEKARMALDSRYFAGKQIKAENYDETKFNARDYSS